MWKATFRKIYQCNVFLMLLTVKEIFWYTATRTKNACKSLILTTLRLLHLLELISCLLSWPLTRYQIKDSSIRACVKKDNTHALWFLEHMISFKYRVERNISLSFYKKLLFRYQYEEISRDACFKQCCAGSGVCVRDEDLYTDTDQRDLVLLNKLFFTIYNHQRKQ